MTLGASERVGEGGAARSQAAKISMLATGPSLRVNKRQVIIEFEFSLSTAWSSRLLLGAACRPGGRWEPRSAMKDSYQFGRARIRAETGEYHGDSSG